MERSADSQATKESQKHGGGEISLVLKAADDPPAKAAASAAAAAAAGGGGGAGGGAGAGRGGGSAEGASSWGGSHSSTNRSRSRSSNKMEQHVPSRTKAIVHSQGDDSNPQEPAFLRGWQVALESVQGPSNLDQTKPNESSIDNFLASLLPLSQFDYDKEDILKHRLTKTFACSYLSVFMVVFLSLLLTGIDTHTNQVYLSPSASNSAKNNQVCTDMPSLLSGTYFMDQNGQWSTRSSFQKNSSVYAVTFGRAQLNLSTYQAAISRFAAKIKAVDDRMQQTDLGYAVVAWGAFYARDEATSMSMTTTADAVEIFKNPNLVQVLFKGYRSFAKSSIDKVSTCYGTASTSGPTPVNSTTCECDVTKYFARMSGDSKSFQIVWPQPLESTGTAHNYTKSPSIDVCDLFVTSSKETFPPPDGYFHLDLDLGQQSRSTEFVIAIDVTSLVVAAALNYGVISIGDMTEQSSPGGGGGGGADFGRSYVSPAYPGSPVYCILRDRDGALATPLCGINDVVNRKVYVPSVEGVDGLAGMKRQATGVCSCSAQGKALLLCQTFSFRIRLLTWFYDTIPKNNNNVSGPVSFARGDWSSTITAQGPSNVNEKLAAYLGAVQVGDLGGSAPDAQLWNITKLNCASTYCSVIEIMYSRALAPTSVSSSGLQLGQLARPSVDVTGPAGTYSALSNKFINCRGGIYQDAAIAAMYLQPPQPLVEAFKTCHTSPAAAAAQQIGNSQSLASLLAWLALSAVVVVSIRSSNATIDENNMGVGTMQTRSEKSRVKNLLSFWSLSSLPLVEDTLLDLIRSHPELTGNAAAKLVQAVEKKERTLNRLANEAAGFNSRDGVASTRPRRSHR